MEVIYSDVHRPLWHILNSSKKTTWQTVWNALRSAGIEFDVVSKKEWIDRLRKSNPDVSVNPTYKLVDFFGNKVRRVPFLFHNGYVLIDLFASTTTMSLSNVLRTRRWRRPRCRGRSRVSRMWMRRLWASLWVRGGRVGSCSEECRER